MSFWDFLSCCGKKVHSELRQNSSEESTRKKDPKKILGKNLGESSPVGEGGGDTPKTVNFDSPAEVGPQLAGEQLQNEIPPKKGIISRFFLWLCSCCGVFSTDKVERESSLPPNTPATSVSVRLDGEDGSAISTNERRQRLSPNGGSPPVYPQPNKLFPDSTHSAPGQKHAEGNIIVPSVGSLKNDFDCEATKQPQTSSDKTAAQNASISPAKAAAKVGYFSFSKLFCGLCGVSESDTPRRSLGNS